MTSTAAKAGFATLLTLALSGTMSSSAMASSTDWDSDGMSNTWETANKLNPNNAADARLDADRDGLTNLREHALRTQPRDEDTDNDGQDDGDEAATRTNVRDADSDDDGIRDGNEDFDRDRIANEDEDDARETCAADDDDLDRDNVDDEDEDELRLRPADSDTHDGVQNEDEDDAAVDACSADRNGDGEDDEDAGDRYGTVTAYGADTRILVVQAASGLSYTFTLPVATEVEFEDAPGVDCDSSQEGALSDLVAGQVIAEIDFENGTVEEIELLRSSCA